MIRSLLDASIRFGTGISAALKPAGTAMLAVLLTSNLVLGFSTVVVDAGHGGHDRGGVPGQRLPEKIFALDVAKRVDKLLRANGYRTVMTRDDDTFISLPQRTRIANSQNDAIFVSIHFNSSSNRSASGIETFYYSGSGYRIASGIQNNLMRVCRYDNRGVKRRGFYVLRNTQIPAVLVECGFLTNKDEARTCKSSNYRHQLAVQIARGIIAGDPTPGSRGKAHTGRIATAPTKETTTVARQKPAATTNSPRVITNTTHPDSRTESLARYSKQELRTMFLEGRAK